MRKPHTQDLIISANVLEQAHLDPAELLIELAAYLYDKERLTMGQAKKLAQLSQLEFQQVLADRNICIKYDIEDLETDLRNLSILH